MDTTPLRELGLQDGEIRIYLALLSLGEASAARVAKHTGLHRPYVYDLFEKLREKGLVSHVAGGSVRIFSAAHPRRLLEHLKEKEESISQLIPALERTIAKSTSDPNVETFKGKEGLKTILSDILKERKDYYLFGTIRFEEILPAFTQQFVKRADSLMLTERAILASGTNITPTHRHEYRYIDRSVLFPNAVIVYGNKTAIFLWDEPFHAILIQSKAITQSYRNHFNLLWSMSESRNRTPRSRRPSRLTTLS